MNLKAIHNAAFELQLAAVGESSYARAFSTDDIIFLLYIVEFLKHWNEVLKQDPHRTAEMLQLLSDNDNPLFDIEGNFKALLAETFSGENIITNSAINL